MKRVTWSKVEENGKPLCTHSKNNLYVDEFDDNIINPEKAVHILKEDGLIVTFDEASAILEFLYKLAGIALSQNLPK